jgi:hypothetical protein
MIIGRPDTFGKVFGNSGGSFGGKLLILQFFLKGGWCLDGKHT